MTEVHKVIIQIARPSGPGDPGEAEWGHYVVADDMVTLTDREGHPLTRMASVLSARGAASAPPRWERKLGQGENALQAARQLLWTKYRAAKSGSDFNRPLRLPPLSIA